MNLKRRKKIQSSESKYYYIVCKDDVCKFSRKQPVDEKPLFVCFFTFDLNELPFLELEFEWALLFASMMGAHSRRGAHKIISLTGEALIGKGRSFKMGRSFG